MQESVEGPFVNSKEVRLTGRGPNKISLRDDFVSFSSFRVGGGGLSEAKLTSLDSSFTCSSERQWLYRLIVESVSVFGPVLYVGEASCLQDRLMSHLSGSSPLRSRMETLDASFECVTVSWLALPEVSIETRQLLEQILTLLFVAPLSHRAG